MFSKLMQSNFKETSQISKLALGRSDLRAESLLDLVAEGLVKEEDVDSFSLPLYTPCKEEVAEIVEREGSFDINELKVFEVDADPLSGNELLGNKDIAFNIYVQIAKNAANAARAVTESILCSHFGDEIMDRLFTQFAARLADHLSDTKYVKGQVYNIAISLTKK
ncbi:hypothetical protein DITRI_Ditri20bG0119800 [Diplodiscus trichospermus]